MGTQAPGRIGALLAADHRRLGQLLDAADAGGVLSPAPFEEFRAGILRHIGMEEKILLPAAKRWRGGTPLEVAAALRLDHGVVGALLVPSPTVEIVAELRALLAAHDALEEGEGGLYALCDALAGDETDAILARLEAAPTPPLAAHFDGPGTYRTAAAAREMLLAHRARKAER